MLYSSLESAKHACNHKASCSDFQAPGSATSSLIQDRRQLSSSCCCPTAWSASNAEVFRCIKSSKEMHCISLHLNHPAAQLYASWRAIMRVHLVCAIPKLVSERSNEQNETQRQTTKDKHDKQHGYCCARLLEARAMECTMMIHLAVCIVLISVRKSQCRPGKCFVTS